MAKLAFAWATEEHARALAPIMRPADAAEVRASCGREPLEALDRSIRCSTFALAGYLDGKLAAIFGCAPASILTGIGVPWLLTGPAVEQHPRTFLEASREALRFCLEHYPILTNAIDARHTTALRWAKRIGFEVRPAQPFGVSGLPFHTIVMRRSHV